MWPCVGELVENVVVIPLGLMLADARTGHSRRESLRLTLKALMHNPMILGILAGLLVSALDLGLPGPVDKALGMLAGGSAATALLFASVPMMSIYPVLGQRFGHEKLCAGALLAAALPHLIVHGPR
ncbi:MAG: malonate transporter [Pseudomonadota bacterium]|nr:malonate transporter [Pseudomonadota bacterium]